VQRWPGSGYVCVSEAAASISRNPGIAAKKGHMFHVEDFILIQPGFVVFTWIYGGDKNVNWRHSVAIGYRT